MKFISSSAIVALALVAGGCGAASNHSTAHQQPVGKPGAPVDVQLTSGGKLASGAQAPLALSFRASRAQALDVEYRTEGALALQSAERVRLSADQNGIASDAPMVRALADGVHYLNVFVIAGNVRRVVSIPVTVGTAQPANKPAGKTIATPQGENLIVLPADGK